MRENMFVDKNQEFGFEHVKFGRFFIDPQGKCQVCECGIQQAGPHGDVNMEVFLLHVPLKPGDME